MANWYAQYPASSGSGPNASIGANGLPIPTSSTLVGGEDPSGDLQPLQVDAEGDLKVSVSDIPLPPGAATAANQVLEIAELTDINTNTASIDGKTPVLGQAAMAASVPVVIASDQSALDVIVSGTVDANVISSVLPTGAATEATLLDVDANTLAVSQATQTPGAAIPARVMQVGGTSGSNIHVLSTDASGRLNVAGITNTVNVNTNAEGAVGGGSAASESMLAGGQYRTSPLTLTNLQQAALALDVSGNLMVDSVGGATEATLASLDARVAGSLVPLAFDEQEITYVTVGNGIGEIETVVYKLATVTVATLTMSYDVSNRLIGVVRT